MKQWFYLFSKGFGYIIFASSILFTPFTLAQISSDPATTAAREHEKRLQEEALRRQQRDQERSQSRDIFLEAHRATEAVETSTNRKQESRTVQYLRHPKKDSCYR